MMDLYTKNLVISFLSVLFPLFLWQLFYLLHYIYQFKWVKKWMFAVFPMLSIILCMTFPIAFIQPLLLDFRRIPLILGTLYGGYKVGFLLLSVAMIDRYVIDGEFYLSYNFILLITTICAAILSKYYLQKPLKVKMVVNSVLIFLSLITPTIFPDNLLVGTSLMNIRVEHWFLNVIGMLITTLLTEVILINFDLLHKSIKAKKLEVASHLAASISHEIGNPLTATKGFIQLLSDEKIPIDTRNDYLKIAAKELDQAIDIIDDYLVFAKPAFINKEKISVYEVLQSVVTILTPLANINKVKINTSLSVGQDCFVLGERKKFEQCLINIVKNSIESMTSGGDIQITIESVLPSNIRLNIQDKGIGMNQGQIDRLGEPYFSTKENGTGLGMMVSFSVIKGMGGDIKVKSENGKGTFFSIQLPTYNQKFNSVV